MAHSGCARLFVSVRVLYSWSDSKHNVHLIIIWWLWTVCRFNWRSDESTWVSMNDKTLNSHYIYSIHIYINGVVASPNHVQWNHLTPLIKLYRLIDNRFNVYIEFDGLSWAWSVNRQIAFVHTHIHAMCVLYTHKITILHFIGILFRQNERNGESETEGEFKTILMASNATFFHNCIALKR